MKVNKDEFKKLLIRYRDGLCSGEERRYIEKWYEDYIDADFSSFSYSRMVDDKVEIWQRLDNAIKPKSRLLKIPKLWRVAAAFAIAIGGSLIGWKMYNATQWVDYRQVEAIRPAIQQGQLILSNGTEIDLNKLEGGAIRTNSGLLISKEPDGSISYRQEEGTMDNDTRYNTLLTPKGQKYSLILGDGTKVTLNAGSSIRFPNRFVGAKREVYAHGELFFDVAHNVSQPFVVETGTQQIEVLGTKFIVDDFEEDGNIKTSLLQGKVRLSASGVQNSILLLPGQQGVLQTSGFRKSSFNLDRETAWINNDFFFVDVKLPSILRELERWYDVDVSYEPTLADIRFSGAISRTKSLQEVLDIMSSTGRITFEIRGRTLLARASQFSEK